MLLPACATLALFNGWWHLGRDLTLSPAELANAFEAPLLAQADSNATADDLLRSFGRDRVQYGVSEKVISGVDGGEADAAGNLQLKPSGLVSIQPNEESIPGSTKAEPDGEREHLGGENKLRQRVRRLGFKRMDQISMPRDGDVFG